MNVGEKDVPGGASHAHVILHVQRQLEVIAPVATAYAVVGKGRVLKKNLETLKVLVDTVQHDDVRRNYQEIACQVRIWFVEFVIKAPDQNKAQQLGLAGSGRHFYDEPAPSLVKHASGNRA